MAEEVVMLETPESAPETPEVEAPTQPEFDETTWKKRLAGKDQALTATQKERDSFKNEVEELRKWKAEKEQADLTELEKAAIRNKQLEAELASARALAERERLARKFPNAADLFDEDMPLPSEEKLEELESRLAAKAGAAAPAAAAEPTPRIDLNNPKKPSAPGGRPASKEEARAALLNSNPPEFMA